MKKGTPSTKKLIKLFALYRNVSMPWVLLVLGFVIGIVSSYLEVETVNLTANIIDGSKGTIRTSLLVKYLLMITITGVIGLARTLINGKANQKINLGIRTKLWSKLMFLPMSRIENEGRQTLVSRVTSDANSASEYFSVILGFIIAVYSAVVACLSMYEMNVRLSNQMMIILPIIAVISFFIGKLTFKVGYKSKATLSKTTSYLAERTLNLRLIKATNMKEKEVASSRKKFSDQFKVDIVSGFATALNAVIVMVMSVVVLVIVFFAGAKEVNAGAMSVGQVLSFYMLSAMVSIRFSQLLLYYTQFTQIYGTLLKVSSLSLAQEESQEGDELDISDSDLVLEDVKFSYADDDNFALNGLSVKILRNKTTAIIGANGSGKSTLFKLIERMYVPQEGEVLFGNKNVDGFNLQSWRKSFAYVSQERALMSGSVRDNICYGVERDVSDEELIRVAKMANVYDFVKDLPNGFNSDVGTNGSYFSGGQCQCIAIARAIMRNPDYLLLDEATSNLDAKCEKMVSEALDSLMRGRTTVMIGHSLSAIRNADYVIVLKDGKAVASGTPQQLMETSKDYKQFVADHNKKV